MSSIIPGKFGSADSIASHIDSDETQGDEGVLPGGTLGTGQLKSSLMYGSDDSPTEGPATSRDNTPDPSIDAVLHELKEIQVNQGQLEKCCQNLTANYQREYRAISAALQEEQYRWELLEEQLSDLTELYQTEILNLKEELADTEEKISYQSYATATAFHEELEACQTRLFRLEKQQKERVQLEGLENATAQTLLEKQLKVLLAVMTVLLVFVSTAANCVVPLMNTPGRMLSTLLFVVFFSVLWRHWDVISEYH